jgi:DNA topoisomerase-3
MTTDAIKKAFASLRENEELQPLEDTALCRSESDWLIGINATRALTGFNSRRGGFFLTPCGRVQTPTLSLLVKRERARHEFISRPYWNLLAHFTFNDESYEGKWIDTAFVKDPKDPYKKADRIWKVEDADVIIAQCTGKPATIQEESKRTSQGSPQLYDLTSLQREANSRFGFSAKNTLGLAQALYERHKVLTYPRTDSKHLPEDYIAIVKNTLKSQADWKLGKFARQALEKNYVQANTRIFNNTKISDHHAIIPTTLLPSTLSEPELKIYQMVVQRFLAVFFPPAEFQNTKRYSYVLKETFLTEGKILLEAGWKAIYGAIGGDGQDKIIAPVPENAAISCRNIDKEAEETKPPARFNEATLLSAMENSDKLVEDDELADAMKERGLGTPATRAEIIETLIRRAYVERQGRSLCATEKGIGLVERVHPDVKSPALTGEWEAELRRIERGQADLAGFMRRIEVHVRELVRATLGGARPGPGKPPAEGRAPKRDSAAVPGRRSVLMARGRFASTPASAT